MVFFSPEDLSIIKNGPGERRRFIDMELCQLDKLYLHNLTKYNKILNQRNHLLKQVGLNQNLLDTLCIWDMQLVEYGKMIVERRKLFIDQLNTIICDIHKRLSGNKEELFIKYVPNVNADEFETRLSKSRNKDMLIKNTSVGPHRDDIQFLIKGVDLRKYGSQGQQRTSALSLKLAEIEMVKRVIVIYILVHIKNLNGLRHMDQTITEVWSKLLGNGTFSTIDIRMVRGLADKAVQKNFTLHKMVRYNRQN